MPQYALPLAAIGPATSAIEAGATAIAAGIVLGGFLVGLASLLLRWEPSARDGMVGKAGYLGGAGAVLAATLTCY